ncbi:MAG: hypothetical protein IPG45_35050 [Deltaproteobacteria bacterium]|jgi:hypothetical protein|nr:hypothetical protein [Deltaproteobacteria bacterium]
MRRRWIVTALGLTACLEPSRVVSLPPELGAQEALLIPPLLDEAPVLPILGQESHQPFTLAAPWAGPLDLLIYDCPLTTFGIGEVLRGPRQKAAPTPSRWLRFDEGEGWSSSPEPVAARPLVPSYPLLPSECWSFEAATVQDQLEFNTPIAAVGLLDDTHLLVADHGGHTVIHEVGDRLSVVANFPDVHFVALWSDRPRRRAYWLGTDGEVGVLEPSGDTWRSRRLPQKAPGFGPCIEHQLSGELLFDNDLALVGVADDTHVELLAAGRCGSLAYYNSRQEVWRLVATGTTTPEADLPRRVGLAVAGPAEWWVSGFVGLGLRRYVDLDQGTGLATPGLVDYGDASEATALVRDTDGSIYIGNWNGGVYRWSQGAGELLTQVTDKVLALFPFQGGLVIAGENGSTAFQHQTLEPGGVCFGSGSAPPLVGAERLHHLVVMSDAKVVSVGVRPGAPEPGIYSRITLQRPHPPPAWACHSPPQDSP